MGTFRVPITFLKRRFMRKFLLLILLLLCSTAQVFAFQQLEKALEKAKEMIKKQQELPEESVEIEDTLPGLIGAVSKGDINKIKELIASGVDINEKEKTLGKTALMVTSYLEDDTTAINIVKLLLSSGADVNRRDSIGRTVLLDSMARVEPNPELIKILLEAGADVNVHDGYGDTPFLTAILKKSVNIEILKLFLLAGLDLNTRTQTGVPVLAIAAMQDQTDVLDLFFNNGVNVNTRFAPQGESLLFWVAAYGSVKTADWLINRGADPELKDLKGYKAVYYAKKSKNRTVEEFLKKVKNKKP